MKTKNKQGFLPEIKPLLIDLKNLVSRAEDLLSDIERMEGSSCKIDTLRLEQQCAEQPELVSCIGDSVAEIRYTEKSADLLQKTIEGTLKSLMRGDPDRFGLEKTTDKAVDECYTCSREYFKSQTFSISIFRVVEKAKNAMLTLEHRRSALRIEERLYSGEYFQVDQPLYLSRAIKEKDMDNKRKKVVKKKQANRARKDEEKEDDKEESESFGSE